MNRGGMFMRLVAEGRGKEVKMTQYGDTETRFQPPCGTYNPCKHAKHLEIRGELERGFRDQEITRLEKRVKELEQENKELKEQYRRDWP